MPAARLLAGGLWLVALLAAPSSAVRLRRRRRSAPAGLQRRQRRVAINRLLLGAPTVAGGDNPVV